MKPIRNVSLATGMRFAHLGPDRWLFGIDVAVVEQGALRIEPSPT